MTLLYKQAYKTYVELEIIANSIIKLEGICITLSDQSKKLINMLEDTTMSEEQIKQAYNQVRDSKEIASNMLNTIGKDPQELMKILGGDNTKNFMLAVDIARALLKGDIKMLDFHFYMKSAHEAQQLELSPEQRVSLAKLWLTTKTGQYYRDQYEQFGSQKYRNLGNEYSSKIPDGKQLNDSGMELYEAMIALANSSLKEEIKDIDMIDYYLKETLIKPKLDVEIQQISKRLYALYQSSQNISKKLKM